jgi:O-antigen/teichoic acid export membrane protein
MKKPRLFKNSLSLLVNRLTQGIASFVITTVVARNLGAHELGQYILAVSYYYIFVTLVGQGLKTLFTRELAKEAEATSVYLVSGTFLQLILSIIGYVLLVCVVFILPYSSDTSMVCYIMGLAVIPFALSNITEAIFQAQENMHLIAMSTIPIYFLRTALIVWIVNLRYSVNHIAAIMIFSEILILFIQWIFLVQTIRPVWEINKDFMLDSIYSVRTFFAIDASGVIATKMNVLLISLLGNESLLGLHGMIGQLMQPFGMISDSVALASFPAMSKAVSVGKDKQREETENVLEILLCISLPFVLGILFFGGDLLLFIYSDSNFGQAILPLKISAVTIIASPFVRVFCYLLAANGFEKYNLLEVIATTIIGCLSGVVLIAKFQLIGASLTGVIIAITACSLLSYAVYSRLFSLQLLRIMVRPILIGGIMSIIFSVLQKYKLNFLLISIISVISYCILACLLAIFYFGGVQSVWKRISGKKR